MPGEQAARKLLGAWYTPPELIELVVDRVLDGFVPRDRVRVLDPACGDGRFLVAVIERLGRDHPGVAVDAIGCDIDPAAIAAMPPGIARRTGDALTTEWGDERFDLVVGNPPFLSQMAAATSRGGASRHGGGPYADAAVEFLALSVALARPDGGRVGLVLPQSILGARDAAPVRAAWPDDAELTWSWWSAGTSYFDAAVHVCALGFERPSRGTTSASSFTRVVTDRLGIPAVDPAMLLTDGTVGDRGELNANFRDEYYALVGTVDDAADGPPLVTSGLIDPGRCLWGSRPVTFAKQRYAAPRVDLALLPGRFPAWAARKLVPKVLVANQTTIVEAVADPVGEWLPGVPVTTVTPPAGPDRVDAVWRIAAVLTSPVATVHAWHGAAGTGLSTRSVRLGPSVLAGVPWPAGPLDGAVAALQAGDVVGCAALVAGAYGLPATTAGELVRWWEQHLPDGAL